jgi:hypothetical protein
MIKPNMANTSEYGCMSVPVLYKETKGKKMLAMNT